MRAWLVIATIVLGVAFAVLAARVVATRKTMPLADALLVELDEGVMKLMGPPSRDPRERLEQMVAVDQFARGFAHHEARTKLTPAEDQRFMRELLRRWATIDLTNTEDLKLLLDQHGWFKIGKFGAKADHDAWLLVQHADHDVAFQREVLTMLAALAPQGETNRQNYALLWDRVASSAADPSLRRLQRYGTQGTCTGKGTWEPHPSEAPEELDARRAAMGLPPMTEYMQAFKDICQKDDR